MLRDEYNKLKTADGFLLSRTRNDEKLYSILGYMNAGYLREELNSCDFDDAQRVLNDFYLIEENLTNAENKKEGEKLQLIYNETEKCLARIKELTKFSCGLSEHARTIRMSNEIFWNGVKKACKIAFNEVNPTVRPHVVYRVNWWYNLLK